MIEIDRRGRISETVVFLPDGKHFVSGDMDGKIRRWRAVDGKEVGTPMEAGGIATDIAVSPDGRWVASGTLGGGLMVWHAESHEELSIKFKTTDGMVFAIDMSPDGTKIATGSGDSTACVWSLDTGERLLDPLQHDNVVVAVKFSPDAHLIATATEDHSNSVRIYDSQDGSLLLDFPITISDSASNQSLAWTGDSKQLFALSRDSNVNCLDVSTGTTLSQWPIHSLYPPKSIAIASNGTFIAVAADAKVSFWDTTTSERIGSVIDCADAVTSITVSANYDIVTTTGSTISLSSLCDVLPLSYLDGMARDGEMSPMKVDRAVLEELTELACTQDEGPNSKISHLEQEISRVKEENVHLKEIVESLHSDIRDLREKTIVSLENSVRDLHTGLAESKRNADQAIESLRGRLDKRVAHLEAVLEEYFLQPDDSDS